MIELRPETTDARLVMLARAGEHAAFDALVRRFQRAVHGVAFAVLADREAALDVLQESFIAAYRRLPELRDPGSFGAWVCGIARNQAKQACRSLGRLAFHEVPLPHAEPAQSHPDERAHEIRAALACLTEMQADAIALHYMEGYSIAECAALLEVPQGTVKRRLHDARQRLRKEMTDMVKEHIREFALPEDYRVVIEKPSRTHSTAPSIAWFEGRWVMVWQDGEPWEPYDGPFWFMLSESADGKAWSVPRRLNIEPQWQALPKLCVLGDELVLHTHCHHYGLKIHLSTDLEMWSERPLVHAFDVGRSDVFSAGGELFITYPIWRPHDIGDAVEVIVSRDRGESWAWLNQPCPSAKSGITDAAGTVINGRIVIAWRGHNYPLYTGNADGVRVCWSDDAGRTWCEPVPVGLLSTKRGSFELQVMPILDDGLAIIQDVREDIAAGAGETWLALSRDAGRTWTEKAVYSTGGLVDPAIALTSDGSLLLAGSSRTGDQARPWVVHSRVER